MNVILPVPYLDQTNAAPTGCESVSTVMALHYLGYDISIDAFIDTYLDRSPLEMRNGVLWGGDPFKSFVGDPHDPDSMGCYAPVIQKALSEIIGKEYTIIDETNTDTDALIEEYIIGQKTPVIYWATINLRPAVKGPEWKLIDSGESFTWWSNEHCMLLVGCDDTHYIFNDPWENHGVIAYDKSLVRQRHSEQRSMALGIRKK